MADRHRSHHYASRPASANPSRSSLPAVPSATTIATATLNTTPYLPRRGVLAALRGLTMATTILVAGTVETAF
ncbi:hypothetical protein LMH87_002263 [Akanthomyces muscarius]|uniref:Uncharacterized protein n=1 Tax=Akanthomyces muscarius TaxID=2231603 RepID=A0A9W8UJ27_AKAMU|nr:hypothetical protein LMH87_002263 [Akanthomyces muscarius]KAJ4147757.1 hypothetical protein LMH87_002263 [Akanthomyces muscarius]